MNEQFVVPAVLSGERIDRAISMLTNLSRAQSRAAIEDGTVLVGGCRVGASHRLVEGDEVQMPSADATRNGNEDFGEAIVGEHGDLDIRYQDDDVIVLAKPPGLVVHLGAGHKSGTLAHYLVGRYPEITGVGDPQRPGIVHRLDRDTSGLMVVARSQRAFESLVEALAIRSVERRYIALVWRHLGAQRGVIDAPIGRSQARRTRMAVRDDGKEARTGYEVQKMFSRPETTLLECKLETGRTHQIRVHLSAIGHPVVGDRTYGGFRQGIDLQRPFLHAAVLGFAHPVSGEPLEFHDPLPAELQAVLDDLSQADGRS